MESAPTMMDFYFYPVGASIARPRADASIGPYKQTQTLHISTAYYTASCGNMPTLQLNFTNRAFRIIIVYESGRGVYAMPCALKRSFPMEIITHSREETVAAGREFAKTLPGGALIAFTGGLGAGKTAFCQGLAEGLGCTDPVSSPTFAIVNYYRGPRPLAHFDLYRIHTENDLAAAGFYDYLDMGAVVACEWSENCADLLEQEQPIHIHIERVDETTRKITVS